MKKIFNTLLLSSICFSAQADIPSDIGTEFIVSISSNLGVRHANDQTGRKFVLAQGGTIRIIDEQDNLIATPFLDITSKVASGGERGLLGLAFHPDFANNGYFFVNYTKANTNFGDTIIERYQASKKDPNVAEPSTATLLMRIEQDFSNHNGGNIEFGPDGYLYIGMGDGGSGGDPNGRAQDLNSALGKMLRIDVDTNSPPTNPGTDPNSGAQCPQETGNYSVPADNPFIANPNACKEIWAYGLRNPWRWSFDKDNGDLYIGDVGQSGSSAREEINFQAAASAGGEHYGWNCREGLGPYNGGSTCLNPLPTMQDPILLKDHNNGRCSVTGGYNYRGPVTSIQNRYFYADYCSGQIWIAENDGSWVEDEWIGHGASGNIKSFGEDEAGNIYITSGNNIYRITGDIPVSDIIFEDGFEQNNP
ncbi:PQQ-dependent sugar dehydrogenase [Marinicella rhabdoformis]|uniref:PQQ-dependent sugar dehydrogenase n=1 Tax=Marinicella rhabdoformis TaxID=2580566 RepID=UPI0015D053EF|nr:PQQ-dependent sugar dehydrogenase [Marinicella rhabdoformis]